MGSLGLMAISRNEGHLLKEFFEHHISQGIDHFYIGDNNSTDNSQEIYEEYKNCVTVMNFPEVHNVNKLNETSGIQYHAYRELRNLVKTDWLYICDMDEFAYARNGFSTIKEFINTQHEINFDQILIRLKYFVSNGHITQPSSVIHGFTKRISGLTEYPTKAIVKTNKIKRIGITQCELPPDCVTVDSTLTYSYVSTNVGIPPEEIRKFRKMPPDGYEKSFILSNHYFTQSYDYFFKNKALRGRASFILGNPNPEIWYKDKWDRAHSNPCVDDFELSELTHTKKYF